MKYMIGTDDPLTAVLIGVMIDMSRNSEHAVLAQAILNEGEVSSEQLLMTTMAVEVSTNRAFRGMIMSGELHTDERCQQIGGLARGIVMSARGDLLREIQQRYAVVLDDVAGETTLSLPLERERREQEHGSN